MISFSEDAETVVAQAVTIGCSEVRYNIFFFEINGRKVSLTESERTVLECVFDQKGLVATRGMLFRSLYGNKGYRRDVKIVDVFICKIKKKIAAISPEVADHIATVWGRGYALADSKTVDSTRWVIRRKAEILDNLAVGATTRERVLAEIPLISEEELDEWLNLNELYGSKGMRVTRTSIFALGNAHSA
jgi:DNA-binding winged helix-turn-helix (wHTH) protein